MASFSLSPNSLPVSDPALPPQRLFPSTPLPIIVSPPAAAPSPSRPLISARPPSGTPPALSTTPPAHSSPPPSPIPPADSPPPSLPVPPAEFPPPSSPVPPAEFPPPSSPVPPAEFPPPSPIPPDDLPPPQSPPSSPSPPADSPPPPSLIPAASSPPPPSPIPPTNSPPPPSLPSSPIPPASSPPPATTPHEFPHTPPGSPLLPSFSPPPIYPPPLSVPPRNSKAVPSRNSKAVPSRNSKSVPPRNSPSIPPRPILSPPSHTPPSLRHATNSSSPPVITAPPPPPPFTNSSSPLLIVASPPPFRRPAPSPSEVLISPPGNPNDNDSSYTRPSSNGGIGTGGVVGITAVLGIVLLTTIIIVSWCLFKRKKKISGHDGLYYLSSSVGSLPQSSLLKIQATAVETGNISANDFVYSPQEPGGLRSSTSKFTYGDLHEATNGFSSQNLLGSGGFGYVYKGFLADGTEVAVKELKIGGGQGEREFSAEVEIISRIHHRYLVSLVGYCISENKRLLVYEYVPNNTLYYHLHVSELVFDWPTRVRVATGAARGIAYLHEDCHPRVIHRDIKSSNILLDKNFEARVSDFGLAKLAADLYTHVTTRVMGTFGYLAPEYARSGQLSEKSDVFSFGVVLLELITGRKPVDASQPLGDEGLVEWARPLLSHALETEDFKSLVDPRLGMNFVPSEMFRMIEAAAACIRHSTTKRPRMRQIVRAFESLETEDLSNGMSVGESEIYNSAQQSAEIKLFHRMAFGSQNYSTDYFTQGSSATSSTDW